MLSSVLQGGAGLGQLLGGLFGQPQRPTQPIPEAATNALNVSKSLAAQTKLPGQDILETQLGERTAQSTRSLEKMGAGGAGLGALANIYGQEMGQRRNLAVDAARYHVGNQSQLINQENNMANMQNQIWHQNIGDKYNQQAAASSALIGGGMTNVYNGANNLAGANFYQNLFNPKNSTLGGNQNMNALQKFLQGNNNGLGYSGLFGH